MDMNPSNQLCSARSSNVERKTVEKNRREHMKILFSKLNSLVPRQQGSTSCGSKDTASSSLPNQIDEAINYIKTMERNLKILREKKDILLGTNNGSASSSSNAEAGTNTQQIPTATSFSATSRPPRIEVRTTDNSTIEVIMITGIQCQLMFYKAIRVLHGEGVEVVNSNFSVLEDSAIVFHTIHAMINENPRPTTEVVARVIERLNRLTYEYT